MKDQLNELTVGEVAGLCGLQDRVPDSQSAGGRWLVSIPSTLFDVNVAEHGPEQAAEKVAETVSAPPAVQTSEAWQVYVDLQGWRDLDGSVPLSDIEHLAQRELFRLAYKGALLLALIHGERPGEEAAGPLDGYEPSEAEGVAYLAGLCGLDDRIPALGSSGATWLLSVSDVPKSGLAEPDATVDDAANQAISTMFLDPGMAWQTYVDLQAWREFDQTTESAAEVALDELPYRALHAIARRLLTRIQPAGETHP